MSTQFDYGSEEIEKPPLLGGVSILNLLVSAGDLVIFWYYLLGYTQVLLQTETLEEACMCQLAWQMLGVDCVIWGNNCVGYFILGKKR